MSRKPWVWVTVAVLLGLGSSLDAAPEEPAAENFELRQLASPFVAVDLALDESAEVALPDGRKVSVTLVALKETRDALRDAVRRAEVTVKVDDERVTIVSANYRLPVAVGSVRVDCPITAGYVKNATQTTARDAPWGLDKDARIRVWPAQGPTVEAGTFQYPLKQRWFASATQMANEPVFVDGGERPSKGAVYYHYGLDMGGAEGLAEVCAATDAKIISVGTDVLPGFDGTPVAPRYDVVYLQDGRGWFYRYSHLHTIRSTLKPGGMIRIGQPIGLLGKEGGSGGWSHLHFDISGRQPSGKYGIIDGYAFLWDAYVREFQPPIIAVARPHLFAVTGEPVVLDGTRSWTADGKIRAYDWTAGDGRRSNGATWKRSYKNPGVYSEILKVTNDRGQSDYDFAVVHVLDRDQPERLPPSIHAAFWPTTGIRPGTPVRFFVRTFRTTDGEETWNFGDGSPKVQVQSDGNVTPLAKDGYAVTEHAFAKSGTFLVSVERTDRNGYTATARLKVVVDPK